MLSTALRLIRLFPAPASTSQSYTAVLCDATRSLNNRPACSLTSQNPTCQHVQGFGHVWAQVQLHDSISQLDLRQQLTQLLQAGTAVRLQLNAGCQAGGCPLRPSLIAAVQGCGLSCHQLLQVCQGGGQGPAAELLQELLSDLKVGGGAVGGLLF